MSAQVRQSILDAAAQLFLRNGYLGTSMMELRGLSGATTGSIYYHFGSKAGVALALWDSDICEWASMKTEMAAADTPKEAIQNAVRDRLKQGTDNRELFRLVDEILTLAFIMPELSEFRYRIEKSHRKSAKAYGKWAAKGKVRAIEWPVARALILGPSFEVLRSGVDLSKSDMKLMAKEAWSCVEG